MQTKKGAIELSMTTIIVIVIGVTLLILGLVFVRGIFEKARGLSEEAFSSAEKEIQQRMGATDKMYVSGGLRWEVEPGKPIARLIAIQNFDEDLSSSSEFQVEITPTGDKGEEDWFTISQPGSIKAGDVATVPVEVLLPKGLPPGSSYPFRVKLLKGNTEYATQSIIVAVKS